MTITSIISAGLLVVTLAVDTDGSASAKKQEHRRLHKLTTVEITYCQQM